MMARLFIAVWPPAEVLDDLERLDRPHQVGVRWTTREQWHITLRFLGEVDPAVASDALDSIAFSPARARVGPVVEQLGSSVAVVPVGGIDDIAGAVRAATAGVGEMERHPFVGHLTVARLKRGASCALVGRRVEADPFRVDEIALVESRLGTQGARYTTVRRRSAR